MAARYESTKSVKKAPQMAAQAEPQKWITDLFVDPNTGRIFDSLRPMVRLIAENVSELNSK